MDLTTPIPVLWDVPVEPPKPLELRHAIVPGLDQGHFAWVGVTDDRQTRYALRPTAQGAWLIRVEARLSAHTEAGYGAQLDAHVFCARWVVPDELPEMLDRMIVQVESLAHDVEERLCQS